jgi:hypothetical protein
MVMLCKLGYLTLFDSMVNICDEAGRSRINYDMILPIVLVFGHLSRDVARGGILGSPSNQILR